MSGPVQVVVRTRPTATFAEAPVRDAMESIIVNPDKRHLSIKMPAAQEHIPGVPGNNLKGSWTFRYDNVLHNASQETVYMETVAPLVQNCLRGYNGTVLCYGQTGAGKTFTQIGSTHTYAYRGVAPRAISEIFNYATDHPQLDLKVGVSYMEIYNETLVDLLAGLPTSQPLASELELVEDTAGNTHVKGLRVEQAENEEQALQYLFEGERKRAVAHHQLNPQSTRGHATLTLFLEIRSRIESSDKVLRAKLHLIDLAGSERLKKTDTSGDLRAESMSINKSLSYLEQVVVAISNKKPHKPYRQSKLTHLLKDSLGGNSKTILIANIYGEKAHIEETVSTLQFAARMRSVTNTAKVNESDDPALLLKRYERQLKELRIELAMHDSLTNRSRVSYDPYTEDQRNDLTKQLQDFLEHNSDELELESVRQMRELLSSARNLYAQKEAELQQLRTTMQSGGPGSALPPGAAGTEGLVAPQSEGGAGGLVGEEATNAEGISVGLAPDDARPAGGVLDAPGSTKLMNASESVSTLHQAMLGGGATAAGEGFLSREEAFVSYKASEGLDESTRLKESKASHKALKARRQELAMAVNAAKHAIDELKGRLDAKKAERLATTEASGGSLQEAEIIDEEEYSFIQRLRDAKAGYKRDYEQLRETGASLEEAQRTEDESRQQLLEGFERWYSDSFGAGEGLGASQELAAGGSRPETGRTLAFTGASTVKTAGGQAEPQDVMDEDEQFEQMQTMRVIQEEPEALAFVRARQATLKKHGNRR